jgi:hypothetical protein
MVMVVSNIPHCLIFFFSFDSSYDVFFDSFISFCHLIILVMFLFLFNAPPNSLMDLITSPKVQTMEGEGVKACSRVRSTSRVEGCVGASRWD